MKIFYSEKHSLHAPSFEVFDGGVRVPYLETPERVERILGAMRDQPWAEISSPEEFELAPILAVHSAEYVQFLQEAYTAWLREPTDYKKEGLLPASFRPRTGTHRPQSVLGRAGYHIMDLSAPILAGTYQAALASAFCALSGARAIAAGEPSAFALCRPPGHHAGRETCSGYCYFNNAAIAAQWLSEKGRVAIVDIDYHAGNGTQGIFYERADVLTISIHADPDQAYPYFNGYADETGSGPGAGYHHNFPLPDGTGDTEYLGTMDKALAIVKDFQPDFVVISAGMDLFEGDPLGTFLVTSRGIRDIGARLRKIEKPSLIVMEGGYANASLGANIVRLVENFA